MIIRLISFLAIFLVINPAWSQTPVLDSLEKEFNKSSKKKYKRIDILHEIAHHYRSYDIEIAEEKCREAYRLSKQLNYKEGLAKNSLIQSRIHLSKSEFKEATDDANRSLKLYEPIDANVEDIIAVYNTLGMLGNYQNNVDTAIFYFKKGLYLAKENNNLVKEGDMLNNIGITFFSRGILDSALVYYKKSMSIDKKTKDNDRLTNSLNNIAVIYSIQGRYSEALEIYKKILDIRKKQNHRSKVASTNQNIGILYNEMEQYEKALNYFKEALSIYKDLGDKLNTAKVLNSIGNTLIDLNQLNEGVRYLNEGLSLSKETKNNDVIITCQNSMGKIRMQQNEYQLALGHFTSSLELSLTINDKRNIGLSNLNLGSVYYFLGNYNLGLKHAHQGKEIVDELNMLAEQRDATEILAKLYAKLGKYDKAYTYHKQFKLYSDSLFNKEQIEKIAQIEYEFKFQKEKDIFDAKEKKLTKKVEKTSQDLEKSELRFLTGIVIFLVVLLIASIFIFRLRLRHIKSQNENSLLEQKLLRSQMTPHFIFNSMSVLQGMILNKEEQKASLYLSKFSKLLRITLENSRERMTPLINEISALENYVAIQNIESNNSILFSVKVGEAVSSDKLLIPPMIIQPFVENAIEHAFPGEIADKSISVSFDLIGSELKCIIEDNGVGVQNTSSPTRSTKKSLSTAISKERIALLARELKTNGSIDIQDRSEKQEKGTTVTLIIPYKTV